jgi:hypothetical protein
MARGHDVAMRVTEWERFMTQLATAVGAGSLSLAFGCGGNVEGGDRQAAAGGSSGSSGGSGGTGAVGSTGGTVATGAGGLSSPPPGSGGAAAIFTGGAPPVDPGEVTYTENDAGIRTYAVPGQSPDCAPSDLQNTVFLGEAVPETACSAEAAALYGTSVACFPATEAGCDATYDPSCVANDYGCGLSGRATFVCGPLPQGDRVECCYFLKGYCPVGRPFFVAGTARHANAEAGNGWAARLAVDVTGLSVATRRALAEAFTKDGLAEHASVASFSRFALECLALGAPAELVRGAQQAALDEIAHAELAFGLASAYAGRAVRPGALDVAGALEQPPDLASFAASTASEGAVAETVSALIIAAARDAAEDPAVVAALTRVAEEEREHALLAWRTLRWALDTGGPGVRGAVERVFDRAAAHVGFGALTDLDGDERALRAHGYLPVAERRRVARWALDAVVAPSARALLATSAHAIGYAQDIFS